jgi:hypothetical protein
MVVEGDNGKLSDCPDAVETSVTVISTADDDDMLENERRLAETDLEARRRIHDEWK